MLPILRRGVLQAVDQVDDEVLPVPLY